MITEEATALLMKEAAITGCLFEKIIFENLNLKGPAIYMQVGPIFRKREGGGHPAEELQGQFDIVCEARHALPEILEVRGHNNQVLIQSSKVILRPQPHARPPRPLLLRQPLPGSSPQSPYLEVTETLF